MLRIVYITDESGVRWAFLFFVEPDDAEAGIAFEYALPGDGDPVALPA